jgi:hypothetical protein
VLAIGLCAVMVGGCGGGASIGTSATRPQSQNPVLTAQSAKAAHGNVTFAIKIKPKPKTELRILTDGINPVVVDLAPSSPNCSPNPAAPGYICTASLNVRAGNHVFTVTAYDYNDSGLGNALSTNSTGTVEVKPTGTTTVPIVLEGIVQSVVLTLATNPAVGKAAAIELTAILAAADGNSSSGRRLTRIR